MNVIFKLIQNKRIFIITPWKIYDPTNLSDLQQIRFELFLSREELERTKERLIGAKYTYAMQGKWMSPMRPYGYEINKRTQRLEINQKEAETVKLIFQLFLSGLDCRKGMSEGAIANYLYKLGIPTARTGDKWTWRTIKQILQNPVHIGQSHFRMQQKIDGKNILRPEDEWIIVPNAHKPIIDEAIWQEAQDRIATRMPAPHNRMDFAPTELAGLVTCGKCGKRMIRRKGATTKTLATGERKRYPHTLFHCQKRGCSCVSYKKVEEQIVVALKEFAALDNKEFEKVYTEMLHAEETVTVSKKEIEETLNQRIKDIRRRLDFAFKKWSDEKLIDEEYQRQSTALYKELEDCMKMLDNPIEEPKPVPSPREITFARNKILSFIDYYNHSTDKTEKNELLHGIFKSVVLTQKTRGHAYAPATFDLDVTFNDFLKVELPDHKTPEAL
jgi:hypothetical protein